MPVFCTIKLPILKHSAFRFIVAYNKIRMKHITRASRADGKWSENVFEAHSKLSHAEARFRAVLASTVRYLYFHHSSWFLLQQANDESRFRCFKSQMRML